MTADGRPEVTDADRDAAVAALDVHREAGRLDDVGFEDRTVRARRAGSRADLELLFLDLPEPHPVLGAPAWGSAEAVPPVSPVAQPTVQPTAPFVQPVPPVQPAESRPLVSPRLAQTLISLAPFVALVLWFATRSWLWFLLIPVAGIVFGDSAGRKRRRRR